MQATAKTKVSNRIVLGSGAKGAISEHIATAWLLSQGFDVFRNVSPNGRADLLALDWVTDKTIRVDVKSAGFSLTQDSPRAAKARGTHALNRGFDVQYLIVDEKGDCEWYVEGQPAAVNDNAPPSPTWWFHRKTGQRFTTPGNEMTKAEWSYFCYWVLTKYPELVAPFSESFIRDMSVRGRPGYIKHTAAKEITVLSKFLVHVYGKLIELGEIKHFGEDSE